MCRLNYNFVLPPEAKIITSIFESRNMFSPRQPWPQGGKEEGASDLARSEGVSCTGNGTLGNQGPNPFPCSALL